MNKAITQCDTEAREFWSRRYGRPVSDEEVREIASNLSGFFNILKECDDEERNQNKEVKVNEQNTGNHI